MLILTVSGVGWTLGNHFNDSMNRVDVFGNLGHRPAKGSSDATNFLLVGSDSRDGISPEDLKKVHANDHGNVEGARSDTMILVHISKKRDQAMVISFPRDSYVDIPDYIGRDGHSNPGYRGKLNSAYEKGGAALAVATIEQNTGIRIDHYLEINFLSFVKMVDALGGVDVCTPKPIDDAKSGLKLPAGTTHVDGLTGLEYVRTRYSVGDGSDLGRINRQQNFIAAMMHQATKSGTLLNPMKLQNFLDASASSLQTDPGLSPSDLFDLALKIKGLSTGSVSLMTVPLSDVDFPVAGWGSTVLWDQQATNQLFTAIREDKRLNEPAKADKSAASSILGDAPGEGLTVAPRDISVQVLNGAGIPGLANRASQDLRRIGFVVRPARNGGIVGALIVVRYNPQRAAEARTVAAALPGALLEVQPGLGRTIQVTVGTSYNGATDLPATLFPSGRTQATKIEARTADQAICLADSG
jgi:LCP family protein required for cell wall assembly